MTKTTRVWSGIGAVGRTVLVTCAALAAVACGRTAKNGNADDGEAGASGNVVSAGRAGASQSGTSSLGGAGGAAGALMTGGTGNVAAGGANATESASWHWKACDSISPFAGIPVALAYGPEGDDLAVAYEDGSVLLHAESSSEPKTVLRPPGTPLHALALSPDGEYLATAGSNFVQVQRLADDVLLPAPEAQNCPRQRLRFSVESDRLLAWNNSALCVWRVADGALLHRITGPFTSAALSGDRLLAAEGNEEAGGDISPAVKAFTLPGLAALTVALEAPPDADAAERFEISPSADSIVSAHVQARSGVGALWSSDGRLLAHASGYVRSYSPDGALVALGDQLLDARTGRSVGAVASNVGEGVGPITINNGGTRSAELRPLSAEVQVTQVHELTTGDQLRVYGAGMTGAPLRDLAISPDGSELAVGTDVTMLWSIGPELAESRRRAIGFAEIQHDVDFSPTAELFVSGDGWSMYPAEGRRRTAAIPPAPDVNGNCMLTIVRASPENQWLAIGQYSENLRIQRRGSMLQDALVKTPGCNTRMAFSTDERLLATTGPALFRTSDWTRVWPSPDTDVPIPSGFTPPDDLYKDVAFVSEDTELLVSSCKQQPAPDACRYSLYSVTNGAWLRELPQITAHRASVSAESHWVVSGKVLLHLPTDTVRTLEPAPTLAVFTPEGDVIGASEDGALTRYCRTR